MNAKRCAVISLGAVAAAAILYLLVVSVSDHAGKVPLGISSTDNLSGSGEDKTGMEIPDGWETYSGDLLKGRISFAYPSHWQLSEITEAQRAEGMGEYVRISGDGYAVKIQGDGGFPPYLQAVSDPYVVDGVTTVTRQAEVNGSLRQSIYIPGTGYTIWIDAPGMSTDVTDTIISTISIR